MDKQELSDLKPACLCVLILLQLIIPVFKPISGNIMFQKSAIIAVLYTFQHLYSTAFFKPVRTVGLVPAELKAQLGVLLEQRSSFRSASIKVQEKLPG